MHGYQRCQEEAESTNLALSVLYQTFMGLFGTLKPLVSRISFKKWVALCLS